MSVDIQTLKNYLLIIEALARRVGEYQKKKWQHGVAVEFKSDINLLTEVDKKSEQMIVEVLRHEFPSHDILGEEGLAERKDSPFKWIVDPLDGTTNFAHGYPLFCTSIGLEYAGEIVLGVVYEPLRDEMFTAVRGSGAFLNGRKILVSQKESVIRSLVGTGFSYSFKDRKDDSLLYFQRALFRVQGVRRDGVAALDLCYVACGRYDGFFELGLFPWDCAAGMIILMEAGGRVSRFDGAPYTVYDKDILATNGIIHREMSEVLLDKKL